MITGESRPVARAAGDRVVAGTVATDSALRVRVEAVGADTALAGIERLVAEAQASGGRAQVLADRFAALLFYLAAVRRPGHVRGLGAARRPRPGGRTHRHGAGDRLPARARPGHPAGDRAVHRAVGPRRHPGQGPARAGADAHRRHRPVRQDRHAHHRAAHGDRRRRHRRAGPTTRPGPGRRGRGRQRAPAGPGASSPPPSAADGRAVPTSADATFRVDWPGASAVRRPTGRTARHRTAGGRRPGPAARARRPGAGRPGPGRAGVVGPGRRGAAPGPAARGRTAGGDRRVRARGPGPPGGAGRRGRAARPRRTQDRDDHRRRPPGRRGGRRRPRVPARRRRGLRRGAPRRQGQGGGRAAAIAG